MPPCYASVKTCTKWVHEAHAALQPANSVAVAVNLAANANAAVSSSTPTSSVPPTSKGKVMSLFLFFYLFNSN
jgi:hypothetical protein